ncbi:WD40 repeat-containing protein [Heterostelium album PN500]|uniref:WD40 repeat-containing protein n=1 Tax=Heterostelium pallidum (strain ATCC 26659 / Pp 5 / PN500) TaxID=670386 RepID=D3B5N8_HETP5|nr:WD40 repeat-containing protein [Heterostelium album PN500]EFA83186.1 WD40 repeat-containing protein [Heterostelium album PN500]|eukprot:XP_020435303.1 WD40 repeat-containing protein [Heterostelium album PN500]
MSGIIQPISPSFERLRDISTNNNNGSSPDSNANGMHSSGGTSERSFPGRTGTFSLAAAKKTSNNNNNNNKEVPIDIRPITNSLDELIEDVSNIGDTYDLVTITEYRQVITRIALTLQSIKSYFEHFTRIAISNKQPVIEKINYYVKTLDEINRDQATIHLKVVKILNGLDQNHRDKHGHLINSIKQIIPMLGIEIQIINILDQLLTSFNQKDSSKSKQLIRDLIKIFNQHNNNLLFINTEMSTQLTSIQIQLEQDVSLDECMVEKLINHNKMENNQQQQQDEEAFIDPNDAVQELVLDSKENAMMDDDDDADDIEAGGDEDMKEGDDVEMDEDFEDESVQGFFEHTDSVYCVAINRQHNDIIVTGGGDDLAYLWNREDGNKVYTLKGHTDSVCSVGFNFDGTLVATGGMDGVVRVWDVATGELKVTLEGPSEAIEWIQWHPRGNLLLAGSADCCAFMWSTLKGDLLSTFAGHSGIVADGTFTPDGKKVVTISEDQTLRCWNPKDGSVAGVISGHGFHESPINRVAIRSDGVLALTAGEDNYACISNINTNKVVGKLMGHTDTIEAIAFSNNNPNFCFTGSMDGTVKVWDIQTMQPRSTMKHKEGCGITKLMVHPTQPILYSSSTDKTICLWDERNGQLIKQFKGHQDVILDFDMTNDGATLVTAGDDKVSLVFSMLAATAQQTAAPNNAFATTTSTTTTTTSTTTSN